MDRTGRGTLLKLGGVPLPIHCLPHAAGETVCKDSNVLILDGVQVHAGEIKLESRFSGAPTRTPPGVPRLLEN